MKSIIINIKELLKCTYDIFNAMDCKEKLRCLLMIAVMIWVFSVFFAGFIALVFNLVNLIVGDI